MLKTFILPVLMVFIGCSGNSSNEPRKRSIETEPEEEPEDEETEDNNLGLSSTSPYSCNTTVEPVTASVYARKVAEAANDFLKSTNKINISRHDIRGYYANDPGSHKIVMRGNYWRLDLGGEGFYRFPPQPQAQLWGDCNAINLNWNETNTNLNLPIPALVKINNFNRYPFADGFATRILLQNAPLTPENLTEIPRLLSSTGTVVLVVDTKIFKQQIANLASVLNSTVTVYSIRGAPKGSPMKRIILKRDSIFADELRR